MKNISEILPDEPIPDPFEDEIRFNNTVREYILFIVLFLVLSVISHVVVLRYRKRESSHTLPPHPPTGRHHLEDEEAIVDRVALWLCTFSLAVSLGAVLLLPISILGNEVLTFYQDSKYVRWINLSLIQGMWNLIFLSSNLSLFVGLPFAYLFTESEGFPGSKKGLRARIVETVVVLLLLVVLVLGVAFILSFLLGYYEEETVGQMIEVWSSFYLPFLYSLISCLGVLILLLCTPVGFAHLFTVVGGLVLRPGGFLRDVVEEYRAAVMEERSMAHKLDRAARPRAAAIVRSAKPDQMEESLLFKQYREAKERRLRLEKKRKAGLFRRTLAYPLALVVLMALTATAICIVGLNTLQLIVGIKTLPLSSAPAILGEAQLGKRTLLLSMLGPVGAIVEVLLILYLIAASLLGCYCLPGLASIRPRRLDTPMVHIIANCVVVLVLSSALPLLARTLGITNFDLLGDYGRISWLGNFWIVFGYNVTFAIAAGWCLVKKFTVSLRHEIFLRLKLLMLSVLNRDYIRVPPHVINSTIVNSGGGTIKED